MSSEGSKVERRYALTRVARGVYLLPSNDLTTLWRISSYEEQGDGWRENPGQEPKQIKGTFWRTARRPMSSAPPEFRNDDDLGEWLWSEAWEEWGFVIPTRRQAIEDVLRNV